MFMIIGSETRCLAIQNFETGVYTVIKEEGLH
jgi:hypothetical protein